MEELGETWLVFALRFVAYRISEVAKNMNMLSFYETYIRRVEQVDKNDFGTFASSDAVEPDKDVATEEAEGAESSEEKKWSWAENQK